MRKSLTDLVGATIEKTAEEEKIKKDMHEKVIDFFADSTGAPPDSEVHDWAQENGFAIDDVENCAYALAKKFSNFLKGGKSKGNLDVLKGADPKLLEIAINIEMEHTPDRDVSMKIVADHVTELGWIYYKTLPQFEKMLEAVNKKKG